MQELEQSDKTLKLKNAILKDYPSIREFARQSGIPHGTIASALNKGIEGMAWSRVVIICDLLNIDYVTFEPRIPDNIPEQEKRLLAYYSRLSDVKKNKVIQYIEDIS